MARGRSPITTAVILAAGRGSRLDDDATPAFSKPLVRLDGQTLLERTITSCRAAGMQRIFVVTGFRAGLVEAEIRRYDRGDIETIYNPEWERSNGLSLYACQTVVDDDFTLMMADHLFDPSILADLAKLQLPARTAVLAVDYKVSQVFDLDDARLHKVFPKQGNNARVLAATESFGHKQSIGSVKDGIVSPIDCRIWISLRQIESGYIQHLPSALEIELDFLTDYILLS